MAKPTKSVNSELKLFKKLYRIVLFIPIGLVIIFWIFYQLFYQKISPANYLFLFIVVLTLFIVAFLLVKLILDKIQLKQMDLNRSRQEAVKRLNEFELKYNSKEDSYQKLLGLNYALNHAALFASVNQNGSVIHISKKFINLLKINEKHKKLPLEEILTTDVGEQQTIHQLLKETKSSIWLGEIQITTRNNEKLWLEMSIIPMNQIKNNQSILLLCTNISDRISTQKEIDNLNEQRFKKEVHLQKEQASQIVEAQEEERKRIAKDIHDGIGQMLTALKFNIESINTSNIERTIDKVEKLKEVLSFLIKEVRTVTFNLTPPELSDYGIVATLNKLANQLSVLTEKKIYFENKTDFNGRFDSLIETNLYRVVQEAVNNGLKYANSNYILISMSHSEELLSITIDDDGIGFDVNELKKTSSMGLFFMKERISYVNGRIFINSIKGKGTRITINVNIPT